MKNPNSKNKIWPVKIAAGKKEIKRWNYKPQKLKRNRKEKCVEKLEDTDGPGKEKYVTKLSSQFKENNEWIPHLENKKFVLEETVEELETQCKLKMSKRELTQSIPG